MKVTKDNIENIKYIFGYEKNLNYAKQLLSSLLIDIEELNNFTCNENRKLYIEYIDYHYEYSVERVDSCPDYFGFFKLVPEKNINDNIGGELSLQELDTVLCALINFSEIY